MFDEKFEELDEDNHADVRALILKGLGDHWGLIDESLNPDLDDMMSSHATGRTIVLRGPDREVLGTGTIVPRADGFAEIVRMSVARTAQRRGIGRRIVDELVATAVQWNVEVVVLETTTAWQDVVDFYLACGFERTHVANGQFGNDTWFERRCSRRAPYRAGD